MASAQMKQLVRFGHKRHPIDTKKYGQPRVALYWASRRPFSQPGLYLWTGKRHVRLIRLAAPSGPQEGDKG